MPEEKIANKGEAQVAHEMALQIIFKILGKTLEQVDQKTYLQIHYECVRVLRGVEPL